MLDEELKNETDDIVEGNDVIEAEAANEEAAEECKASEDSETVEEAGQGAEPVNMNAQGANPYPNMNPYPYNGANYYGTPMNTGYGSYQGQGNYQYGAGYGAGYGHYVNQQNAPMNNGYRPYGYYPQGNSGYAAQTGAGFSANQANAAQAGTGFSANQANAAQAGAGFSTKPDMTSEEQKEKKEKKAKKTKKPITTLKAAIIGIVCIALCGGAGFGGAYLAMNLGDKAPAPVEKPTVDEKNATKTTVYATDRNPVIADTELVEAGEKMTASDIYRNYNDSVVCITVQTEKGTGAGTGFFITDDGYIMTCYHVVDGQKAISVTLNDGQTSYQAEYVGGDSDNDVAIIKIKFDEEKDANKPKTFHAVTLGKSSAIQVGDSVTAIGNALGELANTTTQGIVSALDRAITLSDGKVMRLLQTDCTINSGNSGGPLFNEFGEVVGIVNAKYSSRGYYSNSATIEGIAFSIPIDKAVEIMDDLMKFGYVTGKPYLGVKVATVSSIMAQQYPDKYVVGAYIDSVNRDSCAEKAGIVAGDIVTSVDGVAITSSAELIDEKNKHKAGEELQLMVFRSGEYFTITVTLDELVPEEDSAANKPEQNDNSQNDNSQNGNNNQNGNGNQDQSGLEDFFWNFPGFDDFGW